jgi:hypothetical protein
MKRTRYASGDESPVGGMRTPFRPSWQYRVRSSERGCGITHKPCPDGQFRFVPSSAWNHPGRTFSSARFESDGMLPGFRSMDSRANLSSCLLSTHMVMPEGSRRSHSSASRTTVRTLTNRMITITLGLFSRTKQAGRRSRRIVDQAAGVDRQYTGLKSAAVALRPRHRPATTAGAGFTIGRGNDA